MLLLVSVIVIVFVRASYSLLAACKEFVLNYLFRAVSQKSVYWLLLLLLPLRFVCLLRGCMCRV